MTLLSVVMTLTVVMTLMAMMCPQVERFALTIQARDSGNPMLYSTAVVSVSVEDANDNPPRFEKNNYTTQVQV